MEITRGIVSAVTNLPQGTFSLDVMPNPIVDLETILVISPIAGELMIQIVDMKGNAIKTYRQQITADSETSFSFDASGLTAGMYIVQPIVDNQLLAVQKILKL